MARANMDKKAVAARAAEMALAEAAVLTAIAQLLLALAHVQLLVGMTSLAASQVSPRGHGRRRRRRAAASSSPEEFCIATPCWNEAEQVSDDLNMDYFPYDAGAKKHHAMTNGLDHYVLLLSRAIL